MNASKYINPLTISITGLVAILIAASLVYFLMIKSSMEKLSEETGIYTTNEQYEGPAALAQANNQVTLANQNVSAVQTQWNRILVSRDPVIDYSNVMLAWQQLINELNYNLATSVNQWMPTTGIKPTGPVSTPAAPSDPNDAIAQDPIVIPLNDGSSITVIGSFPQIVHHIEAWNNFDRIALIDDLSLQGVSPWLSGTYTATIYEFPRNGSKPGKAVPSNATGGTGGGMPGMMGGAPTGMFGPPPGMMGGAVPPPSAQMH
jgi:hypothetical protein